MAEVTQLPTLPYAEKQAARDRKIVADFLRGKKPETIAYEHGITSYRVREIFKEWQKVNPTPRHEDPLDIVDGLIGGYQTVVEDMNTVMEKATDGREIAAAARTKIMAYRDLVTLLQSIRALPHDLGTLRVQVESRVMVDKIVAVMEKFEMPEEAFDALLAAVGGPAQELMPGEAENGNGGPPDVPGTAKPVSSTD